MAEPLFPWLTTSILKQLYQGTLTLPQLAAQRGIAVPALQRGLWYIARVEGGLRGSWAVSAMNTIGRGGAAAGTGAGAGASVAGIAAISTTALVLTAGLLVVGGLAAGGYWASHGDQAIGPTRLGTPDGRERNLAQVAFGQGQQLHEPYEVFLAGNDVFVGRRSDIENAVCASVIGWGLDRTKKVKDVAQLQRLLGPFRSKEEAQREYEKLKVSGSERIRPLACGRVAKFTFDGKEHSIDNEYRFCR